MAAARLLAEAGFSRMVCAREMSREDLAYFVANSPIEAEVFVHGALCVCHSGQCLFSSLVGGRSGNRGECAQPCRLPFATPKGRSDYPLSVKDLSLARYIPELTEMGVASFKIEGRMKSPEYVRDVARIWRRLIDEGRGADDRDMAELASVFSRGGFTDGYYTGRIDSKMLGIRSEEDKQSTRQRDPFCGIMRKIPVTLSAEIRRGKAASLSILTDEGAAATVTGQIPEEAKTAPLRMEDVKSRLSKLGNTPYVATAVSVALDEGLMLPVSTLNALRRSAVEALAAQTEVRRSAADFTPVAPTERLPKRGRGRSAVFYDPDQIPKEAHEFFDILYVPVDRYDGQVNGVFLPPVVMDGERSELETMLQAAKDKGAKHVLIGNLGQLAAAKALDFVVHGDLRLNTTNQETARTWREQGLEDWILSPELTLPQMRDIQGGSRGVVYGRVPLMVTEKCIGKELADCKQCSSGKVELTDRRQVRFPVLREWKHRSLILNSVPVYMADRQADLVRYGLSLQHFIFTVESKAQVAEILRAYQAGTPPKGDVRRLRG